MPSVDELLTDQFYRWELRGRGWHVYPEPVAVEPPFRPFAGHFLPRSAETDDGRRPTLMSGLWRMLTGAPFSGGASDGGEEQAEEVDSPVAERSAPSVEIQAFLPGGFSADRDAFEQLILTVLAHGGPMAFEVLALPPDITVQFVAREEDAGHLRAALEAYFPEGVFTPTAGALENAWLESDAPFAGIVELGLEREFMLPLGQSRAELVLALLGALSELEPGELGVFQVIFEGVRRPWGASTLAAVSDGGGGSFFVNAPEFVPAAKRKVSRPLFATVVRVATRGADPQRASALLDQVLGGFAPFADHSGNRLIPLSNDGYDHGSHLEDLLTRRTHRSGMILNTDELLSLIRLPSPAIRSPKLRRQTTRTKRAATQLARAKGLALGENTHGGRTSVVRLSWEERVRHLHILGASGTGKSTLLFNMIRKGIEDGEGLALLDPHGDLVDRILGVIPEHRIKDVILIDPSDEEYAIGFNVLSAHSEIEKTLLASDLVSVFERLSTSWGDQMGSVLRNAILAFLESPQGGTLSDMRRFLLEPGFRTEFLKTVEDPDIAYYWQKTFGNLTGGKSVGPVLTRLDTFLAPRPIRYMVSQRENRIDFARIMDGGKILLAKLSQGAIGKENSYLLGTLLVSKFQQTAMSRQRQGAEDRRPFSLYIDEFHNFITPSMAEILSGARKYGLGLVLAHQELHQLERDRDVMSAVLSNPCVRICFRVGDRDAKTLESGFSYFEARDLQNLDTGQAIVRVERSDQDFNLTVDYHPEDDAGDTAARRDEVIAASRRSYGKPRAEVEAELRGKAPTPPPPEAKKAPASAGSPSPAPPPPPPPAATTPVSSAPATPPEARQSPAAPASPTPEAPPSEERPEAAPLAPVLSSVDPAPKPPKSAKASTRGEPGKGGVQHKLIQARLKAVAMSLGFSVAIEEEIPPSAEGVDLVIKRDPIVIACEISVTTTVDHEIGNILKCLRAGFPEVVEIATTEGKLRKIEVAARTSLPPEVLPRVRFFLPEAFIAYLQQLVVPPSTTSKYGNFKVKRTFVSLTPEQAKEREQAAAESLLKSVKRKRKPKGPDDPKV